MRARSDEAITIAQLVKIYGIPAQVLGKWRQEGLEVDNAFEVMTYLWKRAQVKPGKWQQFFDNVLGKDEEDTKEYLQKEKLKKEIERLTIANSQAKGETFPRSEGEYVMLAIASVLKMALEERNSTWPSIFAGKSEDAIFEQLKEENYTLLENISDEANKLWTKIYERQSKSSIAEEVSGADEAEKEAKRSGVGKGKRLPKPRPRQNSKP